MSTLRRREMLHNALIGGVSSAAFASLPMKLAMAQSAGGGRTLNGANQDYRALVCIYLYGGNDCHNMVIPRDGTYSTYQTLRSNLAVPQAQLLPLNLATPVASGGEYGLHPVMTGTQTMFNAGKAAILANVGPLVRPVNKTLFDQPGTLLPAQLFSHSDQTVLWQTPRADATSRIGWGGRLADIFAASNTNQVLSMNVSLNGDNVFQAGNNVAPYFMSASGVEQIESIQTGAANCVDGGQGWNRRRCLSFNALLNQTYGHPFERAYVDKTKRTIQVSAQVGAAIAAFPENDPLFRPFWDRNGLTWNPANLPELPELAAQLLMIARVIRARATLQMSRQLFFAGVGGFDTHDNQLTNQPPLLKDISQSVQAFYDVLGNATVDLVENVTSFTASDFGRTLTNNGDGTDHGWGGHHFVFGGCVVGQKIYGKMPSLLPSASNPDDASYGQVIPTLAVDQYAATLTKWYGLSDADRGTIFPNLQYMTGAIPAIAGPDLGFMRPLI
jgi:uncharacterized protein (DUF1501 family)